MGDERRPEKQQVIDALVIAFSYSRAAKLVGTDALRSVIGVEYHDIVRDGTFDMQPVWDLLEGQPGFEADTVTAPLCVFKSWEDKLGLSVKLPTALAELSDKEVALHSSQCKVPPAELKALFQAKEDAARSKAGLPAQKTDAVKKARKPKPRWLGVVAGVVGTLGLGYASFALYQSCNPAPAQWEKVASNDVKKFLPGTTVSERLGNQLIVTVDANWFTRPEEERRSQMRDALASVQDRGVKVLSARDPAGVVRVTAQTGRDGQTHIWFKK
jgi:hypothetical protein